MATGQQARAAAADNSAAVARAAGAADRKTVPAGPGNGVAGRFLGGVVGCGGEGGWRWGGGASGWTVQLVGHAVNGRGGRRLVSAGPRASGILRRQWAWTRKGREAVAWRRR